MQNMDFKGFSLCGKKIALAVSGGRDSMALLDWFLKNHEKAGAKFFVVNVEHGIRGDNSKADSRFVEEFCKANNVAFKGFLLDVPALVQKEGGTIEEVARKHRYVIFDGLLASGQCDAVALAHNADDQAETVLMRILRGTGIGGLAGMENVREGYLRPMLCVGRDEIDRYILENAVPYRDDETNEKADYTRNFIRLELFPLIKTRYPDVRKSLARLARLAAEEGAYMKGRLPVFELARDASSAVFQIVDLQDAYPSKLAFMRALKALGAEKDIEETHLDALFALASKESGSMLNLPYGINAYAEYKKLALEKEAAANGGEKDFLRVGKNRISMPAECGAPVPKNGEWPGFEIEFVGKKYLFKTAVEDAVLKGELLFDAEKLPADAIFRSRKQGDSFKKFGGGTKSLSDFLTDKKIPKRKRDSLLLIASGSEVFAVLGVEISEKIKVDKGTKYAINALAPEDV